SPPCPRVCLPYTLSAANWARGSVMGGLPRGEWVATMTPRFRPVPKGSEEQNNVAIRPLLVRLCLRRDTSLAWTVHDRARAFLPADLPEGRWNSGLRGPRPARLQPVQDHLLGQREELLGRGLGPIVAGHGLRSGGERQGAVPGR